MACSDFHSGVNHRTGCIKKNSKENSVVRSHTDRCCYSIQYGDLNTLAQAPEQYSFPLLESITYYLVSAFTISLSPFSLSLFCYRLEKKILEGNILSCVCDFVLLLPVKKISEGIILSRVCDFVLLPNGKEFSRRY